MTAERRSNADLLGLAALVFGIALAARALFAAAGSDGAWASSAGYRGDTDIWLEAVLTQRAGALFESGLPLRPPGMPWLVDLLWNGTAEGIGDLKGAWRLMGAAAPALLFLCLARPFGIAAALMASAIAGLSTSWLHLSHSINVESPYLVLLLGSMLALPGAARWTPGRAALFGTLSALACLLRAEHLLIAVPMGIWATLRRDLRAPLAGVAAGLAFLVALAPAHLALWDRVARFNAGAAPTPPATEAAFQRIERRTARMTWTEDARAEAEALPDFARRSAMLFVAATVLHRGRQEVTGADFTILEEAFGARPGPLAARPFVASSGPLNLALANGAGASVEFGLGAIRRPPPLEGGAKRYPPDLIAGLPPARLSPEYTPHLDTLRNGHWQALAGASADPVGFAGLVTRKLVHAWRGASAGFGGYALPLGPSGTRRPVDIVADEGILGALWSLLVLLAAGAGFAAARRDEDWRAALAPWLILLAARFGLAALFFGYARHGALALPAVALLLALFMGRFVAPRLGANAARVALIALGLLLSLEIVRAGAGVSISIDGAALENEGPPPAEPARVEVRYGAS